jgi:hypothetical protein
VSWCSPDIDKIGLYNFWQFMQVSELIRQPTHEMTPALHIF